MTSKVEWKDPKLSPPPNEVMVKITGSSCWGSWESAAMRKDYKKPPPGCKNAKNYRNGWRWIDGHGNTLSRKDTPDAWADLN